MKFFQIVTFLFAAALAHAAVVDLQRSCQETCLNESNDCARAGGHDRQCDTQFRACKERCDRERNHGRDHDHHDHDHDHDHHHDHHHG
ncbi:hypothetical protein SPI_02592 [Niveomyces insectorum RCEF 264]|uniref:Uncharacterized protein n=1 Tax=Niveomyces insectorum RCEF 264 TaxID=1081102 RepID=A0A167Y3Z4_9HYPO|nr:hypothetical protein SPI_02592 [Niveomyces insectorum RCEF 264]